MFSRSTNKYTNMGLVIKTNSLYKYLQVNYIEVHFIQVSLTIEHYFTSTKLGTCAVLNKLSFNRTCRFTLLD